MTDTKGTSITASLQLMKALSLARRGKLDDAEATLTRGSALPDDPLRLQALAALTTSQGDYERGLALWRLLLVREPSHAEANKMVASIELWLSRPPWFRFIPIFAALLVVSILTICLTWAFSEGDSKPSNHKVVPAVTAPRAASPVSPAARPAEVPRSVAPATRTRR